MTYELSAVSSTTGSPLVWTISSSDITDITDHHKIMFHFYDVTGTKYIRVLVDDKDAYTKSVTTPSYGTTIAFTGFAEGTIPDGLDTLTLRCVAVIGSAWDNYGTKFYHFELENPDSTTLLGMRNAIRLETDQVNSDRFTDDELNILINASYRELFDLVNLAYDQNYLNTTSTITVAAGVLPLPTDFYQLVYLDVISGSDYIPCKRFTPKDREVLSTQWSACSARYRLSGSQIAFSATPPNGTQFRISYIPELTDLVDDSDESVFSKGWEQYVIADVCIKIRQREEEDPSIHMAQKQAVAARIQKTAQARDRQPETVGDVETVGLESYYRWGY